LYFDEFKELFEKYFKNVILLGQRICCNSHIWPVFSKEDGKFVEYVIDRNPKEFVFVEKDKRIPLYFIAIASDMESEIDETESALIDVSVGLLKQKDEQIAAHVRAQNRLVEEIDEQIAAHVREQKRLVEEIDRLSATVQDQQSALAE